MGALKEDMALRIFQQIIEGLDYCHKHFVCHRDLKPENILLDAENNIKIADFGMSGIRSEDSLFETSCGSPHYASPEVVQGIPYDGEKADIWSCGVILYALVSGKLPFDNENIRVLLGKVKSGIYTMPAFLPNEIQDLISKMLVVDPKKRITIENIRNHPWYKSNTLSLQPTPSLQKSHFAVREEEVQEDIIDSLRAFGFGTPEEITELLTSTEENYIKTLYELYLARKNEPRAIEKNFRRISRAKSETSMRKAGISRNVEQASSSLKPSQNMVLSKKRKLLVRRRSYVSNTTATVSGNSPTKTLERTSSKVLRIKLEPQKEKIIPEPVDTKGRDFPARKSWLPGWFGSSDANLKKEKKKNLKEGVESRKTIGELSLELEQILEALGATFCFTHKRDKIKARITKESKSIKFAITIVKVIDDDTLKDQGQSYWITFSRRSGDKALYNEICENIKRVLDV